MAKLADVILTASSQSFRVPSPKVVVTGHGIDLEQFTYQFRPHKSTLHVFSVGRISPTKDYETLIQAVALLRQQGASEVVVSIIGESGLPQQVAYHESLKQLVTRQRLEEIVQFIGPVPNREVARTTRPPMPWSKLAAPAAWIRRYWKPWRAAASWSRRMRAFRGILGGDWVIANDPVALAAALRMIAMDTATRQTLGHQLRSVVADQISPR